MSKSKQKCETKCRYKGCKMIATQSFNPPVSNCYCVISTCNDELHIKYFIKCLNHRICIDMKDKTKQSSSSVITSSAPEFYPTVTLPEIYSSGISVSAPKFYPTSVLKPDGSPSYTRPQ